MATKLITAPDGSHWFSTRSGYVPVKKKTEPGKTKDVEFKEPELDIPVLEPDPPKPKHKTYKLHYTKGWRGTYGKFLNTFGNQNFPHFPNYGGLWTGTEKELGNLYFIYNPSGPSEIWMKEIVGEKMWVARWRGGGEYYPLKPMLWKNPGWPDIRAIASHLKNEIQNYKDLNSKTYIPLASPFKVKEEEKPPQEPKPKPEVKKRGCDDPSCHWCNAPKIAVKKKALGHKPGESCMLCGAAHTTTLCPLLKSHCRMRSADEFLWDTDDWKNPFCISCGSMEHVTNECDWKEPPKCKNCGYYDHESAACPNMYKGSNNTEQYGGRAAKGRHITVAPWAQRGQKIDFQNPPDEDLSILWPVENMEWDPLVENARLITLEFIAENMRHPTREAKAGSMEDPDVRMIVKEGQERMRQMVDYLDPRLRAYTDMAVGGELRHHRAVGGVVLPGPRDRASAWKSWKKLREILGPQALLDAAVLFEDFDGGGYGGMKWGIPAKILWMRETNRISGSVFLDRVFDLEHNGGCFLNKIRWKQEDFSQPKFTGSKKKILDPYFRKNYDITLIKSWLGPARERDDIDWGVILHFLPFEDRQLFLEYWNRSNTIWRQTHLEPLEVPRVRKTFNHDSYRSLPNKKKIAEAAAKFKKIIPHFGKVGPSGCQYCGAHDPINYKYYCEDPGCTLTRDWHKYFEDDPTFCSEHFQNCLQCGTIICFNHEYLYCNGCMPKTKTKKIEKNPKYEAYQIALKEIVTDDHNGTK